MAKIDPFNAKDELETPLGKRAYYKLQSVEKLGDVTSLPYSLRILLETCLRNLDGHIVTEKHIEAILKGSQTDIPFFPARVVLQDFTGVPVLVDLASMRSAIGKLGGDAKKVNPLVPSDLVIDHSVQVDAFNSREALEINTRFEVERNRERYKFLKWGQSAFDNMRIVPPATGIVHQVNLEYLGKVVWDDGKTLFPDSLIGTDSHTTMINGLGILGWGVGGIEAEAVMLGEPYYMLLPEVVGFRLVNELPTGSTATDLVLTITKMLRDHGVVGKFVEFFGPGLMNMPVANRATIANMAPEYGATAAYFPIDERCLEYLDLTGRPKELIDTVERYAKEQMLWYEDAQKVRYSSVLELDLSIIEPSLAGPKRPQDLVLLREMKKSWHKALETLFAKPPSPSATLNDERWLTEGGAPTAPTVVMEDEESAAWVQFEGARFQLKHGDVVIAAITSCTNTSNPEVMVGAGLLARKARAKGLTRKPWVKTSLAPGSKVVTEYLGKAGLMEDLEATGFYLVGYGCTTCIGNSGPLPEEISKAIREHELVTVAVLSGNRNFEGRINPDVRGNYLASPPLVVAYAIAGTVDIDLLNEPLGKDKEGNPVFLRDIWPSQQEIYDTMKECISREQFIRQYAHVFEGSKEWQEIPIEGGLLYDWPESTYIKNPPYFDEISAEVPPLKPIRGARCLVKLGDSITTDHISPAGSIKVDSPAGKYLIELGVKPHEFNSYGSRRGNHEVMMRGTFANVRLRNQLVPEKEGGWTLDFTDNTVKSIYDAAMNYRAKGIPLIVLAGKDYGMGSSRDWAAKGTALLGVKAVIAESYERIHRSNLVGMGVLPLAFLPGENVASLGLTGREIFDIEMGNTIEPGKRITVRAQREDGSRLEFETICRIDLPVEVEYYRHGGILPMVLRKLTKN
ncbi:MAG TPA: aconitate hydratase AcnA [Fimbriimonadales bacterium]|nr:aconitate hydratase AcnA [Fimbriimonadales bacterium]